MLAFLANIFGKKSILLDCEYGVKADESSRDNYSLFSEFIKS
jgi:hypothetical protein